MRTKTATRTFIPCEMKFVGISSATKDIFVVRTSGIPRALNHGRSLAILIMFYTSCTRQRFAMRELEHIDRYSFVIPRPPLGFLS